MTLLLLGKIIRLVRVRFRLEIPLRPQVFGGLDVFLHPPLLYFHPVGCCVRRVKPIVGTAPVPWLVAKIRPRGSRTTGAVIPRPPVAAASCSVPCYANVAIVLGPLPCVFQGFKRVIYIYKTI